MKPCNLTVALKIILLYKNEMHKQALHNEVSIYMKGLLMDSDKEWYHEELTREQAEMMLRDNDSYCFLIRESKDSLVLSLINHGETHYVKITYQLGWYSIDGLQKKFKELNQWLRWQRRRKC